VHRPTFRERMLKAQPKLIKKIEEYFLEKRKEDITFGKILNKYCEVGESRDVIRERLIELTKGEISISDTTLYESIIATIRDHKTKFEFSARKPDNPLAKYKATKIKRKKQKIIEVRIFCLNCDFTVDEYVPDIKNPIAGIETFHCPDCDAIGNAVAEIHSNEVILYKAMRNSEIYGIQTEQCIPEMEYDELLTFEY